MKQNVTLTINIKKRALFEASKPIHEKTLSDALEIGMNSILEEYKPEKYLRIKIAELEVQLQELKTSLEALSK